MAGALVESSTGELGDRVSLPWVELEEIIPVSKGRNQGTIPAAAKSPFTLGNSHLLSLKTRGCSIVVHIEKKETQ